MKHSTGKPTKAQEERFRWIREVGCVACRMRMRGWQCAEVHHLTVTGQHGGKRRGHDFTVGLCPYHHRGALNGMSTVQAREELGPSLALEPRAFRELFGRDDRLLELQDEWIAMFREARVAPVRGDLCP